MPGTDFGDSFQVILGEVGELPFVPELPARGPGAEMIGRSLAMLEELDVDLQPAGWRLTTGQSRDHRRARSLLARDLDAVEEPPRTHGTVHSGIGVPVPRVVPMEDDLRRAADVLNAGRRVAILAGAGALHATDELIEVADRLGAGIAAAQGFAFRGVDLAEMVFVRDGVEDGVEPRHGVRQGPVEVECSNVVFQFLQSSAGRLGRGRARWQAPPRSP